MERMGAGSSPREERKGGSLATQICTSMIHRRHAPSQKSLSFKGSGSCSGKNGLEVEGEKAIVVVVQRMPDPLPMVKARVLIRMCSFRGYCVWACMIYFEELDKQAEGSRDYDL